MIFRLRWKLLKNDPKMPRKHALYSIGKFSHFREHQSARSRARKNHVDNVKFYNDQNGDWCLVKNGVLQNYRNHDFHENCNFDESDILYILCNTLFTYWCHTYVRIKIHGGKHWFFTMCANDGTLLFPKSVTKWWPTFCNIWWYHYLKVDRIYSNTLKFTEETLMLTYFS